MQETAIWLIVYVTWQQLYGDVSVELLTKEDVEALPLADACEVSPRLKSLLLDDFSRPCGMKFKEVVQEPVVKSLLMAIKDHHEQFRRRMDEELCNEYARLTVEEKQQSVLPPTSIVVSTTFKAYFLG